MIHGKKVKHDRDLNDEMLKVNSKYTLNRFYVLKENVKESIKLAIILFSFTKV